MQVTYHAAERFIERVLDKKSFSKKELLDAKAYLELLTKDVVISSYKTRFVLPGFKKFLCIYQENALITIIPKDTKILKPSNKRYEYTREHNYAS
jgi:hypothetical protein